MQVHAIYRWFQTELHELLTAESAEDQISELFDVLGLRWLISIQTVDMNRCDNLEELDAVTNRFIITLQPRPSDLTNWMSLQLMRGRGIAPLMIDYIHNRINNSRSEH
jgi:hypothetical protein